MASVPVYIARRRLRDDRGAYGRAQQVGQRTLRKQLARPVAVYYDHEVDDMIHNPEYIEVSDSAEEGDTFIGLFDHEGEPLYRLSDRIPMGFHHRDDIDQEA